MAGKKFWMVKINRGLDGWKVVDTFKTPAEADAAVARICTTYGVACTDMNIVPITMVM